MSPARSLSLFSTSQHAKIHPASLNVTSHHRRAILSCMNWFFFFLVMDTPCLPENANTGLSRTRGRFNRRVFSSDEQASSWPITLHAAILRHVLSAGQGYPEFIQQQVASFMPWREVKRSPVWAPSQTADTGCKHSPALWSETLWRYHVINLGWL